jgi:hypothetical protein
MSNQGNLLNLMSYGQENQKYKINRNISYDNIIKYFDSNFRLNISDIYNLIYPEFLEIKFSNDDYLTDYNQIYRILNTIHLTVKINGFYVFNIPLKFLLHFNKYEIYEDKFYLDLSFNLFIDTLLIPMSLTHLHPSFELLNINSDIISCGLVIKTIYSFPPISNIRENVFQYISSIQLNNINGSYFEHKLPFNGIIKGLFIECENVDDINLLKIILNDQIKTSYNTFLIRKNCIKINDKLLYYPFNSYKKYNDLSNISFEGSVNFNKIENVKLILNFTKNINILTIYALGSNIIKYEENNCNLIFNYDFINKHIIQNYGETTIIPPYGETIIYKLIINENKKTCNINLEEIKVESRYMNCVYCNNNFNEKSLKDWLDVKKKCPLCREKWLDYSIYINSNFII